MGSSRELKVSKDIETQDLEELESERPKKRSKTLLEEDDTSDQDKSVSRDDPVAHVRNDEAETSSHGFKVNHEFARRFEHNKQREELHKREYSVTQSYQMTC